MRICSARSPVTGSASRMRAGEGLSRHGFVTGFRNRRLLRTAYRAGAGARARRAADRDRRIRARGCAGTTSLYWAWMPTREPGTTPIDARRDTIQAAARILVALRQLGLEHRPDARVSVGSLKPATDGASTIAGRTDFVIDIRHLDAEVLDRLTEACREACVLEAGRCNCEATVSQRVAVAPVSFDAACIDRVARGAGHFGYRARRMASGVLHDASNLAIVAPSAMIFIPCKDGISHNVNKSAAPEDLEAGCNVLLRAVLASTNA